jgi:hypothetical protein
MIRLRQETAKDARDAKARAAKFHHDGTKNTTIGGKNFHAKKQFVRQSFVVPVVSSW